MLFRRRVITPATPTTEREVVVVRPKRPTSLYAALGVATLCTVGLIGYLTYAIYNEGQNPTEPTTTAVIVDERPNGRAQRFEPANNPPQTIIVNPPPVIHMTPTTPNPAPAKQPDTPIIVNGAPQTEEPEQPAKTQPEEEPAENVNQPPADPE